MIPAQFLELLVSLSVQSLLLVAIAAWLARRTRSCHVRDRVWAGCHLSLLLLTVAAIALPHLRVCVPAAALDAEQLLHAASMTDWLGRAALVVWAAGAATHLLMLARSVSQAVRLFRRCRRVTGDLVADYGLGAQPGSGILLLAGPDVPGPLCWQWQRSVIVVPDSLLSFPAEELRAVLRHELAHLRAGHPLQLFLQRLVAALYWFHPAVRWALRRAVRDREFLCDAESVSSREDAAVYLRSLIRLSEQAPDTERQLSRGTALSWGGGHQSLVAERAARLAGGNLATHSIGHSRAASAFLIGMAGLLAVVAWIPVNPLSSPRSHWSPWPAATANVLHTLGIPARDYELDAQIWRPEELRERAR